MSQAPLPVPITPLHRGADADIQLDRLLGIRGSRAEIVVPALLAAAHGFNVPGRLAPPSARGLRAWLDGDEDLRIRLEAHGYSVPESAALDSTGMVISPDKKTGIVFVAGDASTAIEGARPQVKYKRGPIATEYIQGSLFKDIVAEVDAEAMTLWFLLHRITTDGWRAEMSRPGEIGGGGWVTRWVTRIEIAPLTGGGGPRRAEQQTDDVELPAPAVQWRQSA
jgi:hypothetical protein